MISTASLCCHIFCRPAHGQGMWCAANDGRWYHSHDAPVLLITGWKPMDVTSFYGSFPANVASLFGGGEGRVSFFYPKWLLAWNIRPIKKSLTFIFFYFELLIKTRSCFIFVQLHCLQLFWQKCVCLEMVFKTIFLLSFVRYAGTGNLLVCTVRGRTLLDSWQPLCSLPVHFPPLKLQIWLQVVTSNVTKTSIRGKYNSSYSLL